MTHVVVANGVTLGRCVRDLTWSGPNISVLILAPRADKDSEIAYNASIKTTDA